MRAVETEKRKPIGAVVAQQQVLQPERRKKKPTPIISSERHELSHLRLALLSPKVPGSVAPWVQDEQEQIEHYLLLVDAYSIAQKGWQRE